MRLFGMSDKKDNLKNFFLGKTQKSEKQTKI